MGGWVLQYLVYRDRVLRLCCWVLGDGLQDCAIWGNQSNCSRLYTSLDGYLTEFHHLPRGIRFFDQQSKTFRSMNQTDSRVGYTGQ